MTKKTESARETIMNLQRLAADKGATQSERETAARMAEKLIKKFNIDQLSLEKNTGDVVSVIYCYAPRAKKANNLPHWMGILLSGLVNYYGVAVALNRSSNTMEIFGTRAAVDAVLLQIEEVKKEAGKAWREFSKETGKNGATDRKGFFIGYAFGVAAMFEEAKKEVQKMLATGASLVVVDDSLAKAEAAMKEKFSNLTSRRVRKTRVGDTAKAGYAAQQASRSGRGIASQRAITQ